MSDRQLLAAIEQMEAWVADPAWDPDAEALIRWNALFLEAAAHASKGPNWQKVVARAKAVGQTLNERTKDFVQLRDRLKAELDAQELGNRALRGYKAASG